MVPGFSNRTCWGVWAHLWICWIRCEVKQCPKTVFITQMLFALKRSERESFKLGFGSRSFLLVNDGLPCSHCLIAAGNPIEVGSLVRVNDRRRGTVTKVHHDDKPPGQDCGWLLQGRSPPMSMTAVFVLTVDSQIRAPSPQSLGASPVSR